MKMNNAMKHGEEHHRSIDKNNEAHGGTSMKHGE
jgi:hypothetical protein